MKTLLTAAALVLLAITTLPAAAAQVCAGELIHVRPNDTHPDYQDRDEGWQLLSDRPGMPCNAVLQGNELRKVLKVCLPGEICRIKGGFAGHAGSFGWVKIIQVRPVHD